MTRRKKKVLITPSFLICEEFKIKGLEIFFLRLETIALVSGLLFLVFADEFVCLVLTSASIRKGIDESKAHDKEKEVEIGSQKPINVGTQKQFFVDDEIADNTDNVFPILNQPVKYQGNPIIELEPPQTVGGDELVIVTGSVIYDEEERLFKMWYEGAPYDWSHNVVAYAYSRDGINWELPNLGLVEVKGSKNNNIVFHRCGGEMAPGVFKDSVAKDPQSKYKMIYNSGEGVGIAFSPDGIHWTPEGVAPSRQS